MMFLSRKMDVKILQLFHERKCGHQEKHLNLESNLKLNENNYYIFQY